MWILFNPTENDLTYEIDFKKWYLLAGEAKKFPNDVAQQIINLHGFLHILEKDDQKPKKEIKPPKTLAKVKEATPDEISRDRRLKHPSSSEEIVNTGGFSGNQEMSDVSAGLPKTYKKEIVAGKLMQIDKDSVGWYGDGISVDNPLAKE